MWSVGAGCLLLPQLGRARPTPRELTLAYPVGLLLVTAAAVLVLLDELLAPLAALLIGLPLAQLLRGRSRLGRIPLAEAVRAALAVAFASATALTLGLLLHGPTESEDSRAFGDLFYYVNKVVSASRSLVPFHDLLAEGQRIIYVEGAPSFVGAALEPLPGFDPVLFNVVTLPCFLLVALVVGARLLTAGRELGGGVLVATLALASTAYVTFLTESPPMALALPLSFAAYRIWADELSTAALATIVTLVGVDLLLTKVVGLLPVGILLLGVLFSRHPATSGTRRARTITALLVGVAAAIAIAVLFTTADWYAGLASREFFPGEAWRGLRGQLDGVSTGELAPAVTIVGELVLLAWLVRARAFGFATALTASIAASWFIRGIVFEGALGPLLLLLALAALERRVPRDRLFAAGAVTMGLSIYLREVYGVRTGLVLLLLALAALLPGFQRRTRTLWLAGAAAVCGSMFALAGLEYVGGLAAVGLLAAAATVLLPRASAFAAAALAALSVVVAAVRGVELSTLAPTLTQDDFTIWERVRDETPDDALVFTSLTGQRITIHEGWNNYPSIAGRQLYIAGWYDGRLTAHPDERDRRLHLNHAVLTGERAPGSLELSRSFGAYFAVVRAPEPVPPTFVPVYRNDRYALYRVEP